MTLKRIIFGLIVFVIFTTTGICIVNINLQNNNIKSENNYACIEVNIFDENNTEEIKSDIANQETKENTIVGNDTTLDRDRTINTSRGNYKRYIPIKAIVTAYAPYDNKSGICNDGTSDTTATNTKPEYGTLAADPKRIPYGTRIYVPEYGYGTVEDTGSALRKDKDNIRIDVYMDTYEEAMRWGKKEMIVYIIK